MMLKYGTLRDSKKRKKNSKKKPLSAMSHYLRLHQHTEELDEGDEDELLEEAGIESYFSSPFKATALRPAFSLSARRPIGLRKALKPGKQFF